MTIAKAYGRVAEYKSDNARIEVLAFKRQGEFVFDGSEIKQQFLPQGFVFAPKWVERFNYPIGTLIEFQISSRTSTKGDVFLVDIDKECKRVGYPVFDIGSNIMVNELAMQQPVLKELIKEESSHFYIRHQGFTYGPFKTQNLEVLPRTGMTVNKYRLTDQTYECEGVHYFLQEPADIVGKVDCMTLAQLANFLKNQVRKLELNIDAMELKLVLETQTFDNLDTGRIKRIVESLDKLEVGNETLRMLAKESPRFHDQYNKALQNVRKELRTEQLQSVLDEKAAMTKELTRLSAKIEEVRTEQAVRMQELNAATKELNYIIKEKDRLIEDIRVQSLVKTSSAEAPGLLTFEEKVYQQEGAAFSDLSEFAQVMQQSIQTPENGKSRIAHHILYQLEAHKCFLTHYIEPVLQMARLSNNCKVIIQQVEADWLKFERLYHNGLKQIWASANQHKAMFHFFILQDINMASFECYGRPLLDLLSEVREELPGQQTDWPDNLWIFGMPLACALGNEFGLPLLKTTFKHWGYLPVAEPLTVNRKFSTNKVLPLSHIYNHGALVPSFINEYFSEK